MPSLAQTPVPPQEVHLESPDTGTPAADDKRPKAQFVRFVPKAAADVEEGVRQISNASKGRSPSKAGWQIAPVPASQAEVAGLNQTTFHLSRAAKHGKQEQATVTIVPVSERPPSSAVSFAIRKRYGPINWLQSANEAEEFFRSLPWVPKRYSKDVRPNVPAEYRDLVIAMLLPDTGVRVGTHSFEDTLFKKCFAGCALISWLIKHKRSTDKAFSHADGMQLAARLHGLGVFAHACDEVEFRDDDNLYRFQIKLLDLLDSGADDGDGRRQVDETNFFTRLMTELQSPQGGLPVATRTFMLMSFDNVFKGSDLVAWLTTNYDVRQDLAKKIAGRLIDKKLITHCSTDRLGFTKACFYRFTATGVRRREGPRRRSQSVSAATGASRPTSHEDPVPPGRMTSSLSAPSKTEARARAGSLGALAAPSFSFTSWTSSSSGSSSSSSSLSPSSSVSSATTASSATATSSATTASSQSQSSATTASSPWSLMSASSPPTPHHAPKTVNFNLLAEGRGAQQRPSSAGSARPRTILANSLSGSPGSASFVGTDAAPRSPGQDARRPLLFSSSGQRSPVTERSDSLLSAPQRGFVLISPKALAKEPPF